MQEDQFWKKLIFGSFDFRGVFWELRRLFLEKVISEKIVADRSLKRTKDRPKRTSFDPPNVLNKLLSRNLTLIRRCEINKFNLVTYFFL